MRAKIGAKIDQFLPYFFARFYRCIGVKIGFGNDLEIFLEWEGGGNQIERRDESILYGGSGTGRELIIAKTDKFLHK